MGAGRRPRRRCNRCRGRTLSFQVIPAIDLRGGRCVRLFQGDYAKETSYGDDPVAMAQRWEALGAPLIHIVDLDGAKEGVRTQREVIRAVCAGVAVPVEVAGGLRTRETILEAVNDGAARVQLGSAAVRDPELVAWTVAELGDALIVSIDARDGQVMTQGWTDASGLSVLEVARRMVALGVPRLMVTDIGRDGTFEGPNLPSYRELVATLPVPVVASGGVTTVDDLVALRDAGCEGAVTGKALYEGRIDLRDAIARLRDTGR